MAKPNPLLLKVLFIGVPLLIGIAMLPTDQPVGGSNRPYREFVPQAKGDVYSSDTDVASFGSVDGKTVNSFRPGPLPKSLTGGEGDWTYSGNVNRNGSKQAVIVNGATGEVVYLNPGERWKDLRLLTIQDNSITVVDSGGLTKDLNIGSPRAGTSSRKFTNIMPISR